MWRDFEHEREQPNIERRWKSSQTCGMALRVVGAPALAAALTACFFPIHGLVPPEMGTAVISDVSQNI